MKANRALLIVAVFTLCPLDKSPAQVTINWNSVDWVSGNLSQSFDIDASNPGNDITISLTSDNNHFFQPPDDNVMITGGLGASKESLLLDTTGDPVPFGQPNTQLTVDIAFHYSSGVRDLSFTVLDIDGSSNPIRNRVFSMSASFQSIIPQFAPSIIRSSTPTYSVANEGSFDAVLIGVSDNPNSFDGGNATLSFGANVITRATVSHGSVINETFEIDHLDVAISDITYTVVPEPRQTGAVMTSFIALFALSRRLRRVRASIAQVRALFVMDSF